MSRNETKAESERSLLTKLIQSALLEAQDQEFYICKLVTDRRSCGGLEHFIVPSNYTHYFRANSAPKTRNGQSTQIVRIRIQIIKLNEGISLFHGPCASDLDL